MARYTDSVCKLCRREGQKLFLKGERCYADKCAVTRRAYAPGQHGQGRKKTSEYGLQLRAKQTAKRYYGVLESQFLKYYEMATKKEGKTGDELLILLERRLDNIVYRLGWASSRAEARQLVVHGHFTVNGGRVDIPSFLVKPGDVVSIKDKSRKSDKFKSVLEANASRPVPKWLDVNRETLEGKILALPTREEIDLAVDETLIVELYSK
ncbi:30S ribosomal protein S4 [Caprobacter fermentans]|uniref:Small ribosomal subunit protein uS4 n=1 Tax=Caproicibacter fermentans TaxID=2576756 RepID=A0A6N8I3S0_9FIRM|nr:30S ribosomal protein S4 [Caproicibacter fermentans]MVB12609.1 30S ribosomal protein S4 [Caproicibacter fermentans]OCM99986.1 30S ribosomal protein S4 [Clostridium sp. W14A]QNK39173.1 30S ribosomal protein S4 [Caproicibacter fermentans]